MILIKKCSKCGRIKTIDKFHKSKNCKFGVRPECINCFRKESQKRRYTKEGVIKGIYSNQIKRSKKLGFEKPKYSKEELIEWCLNQKKFHVIYENWINSNYNKWYAPSCDRLDDYASYSFDNIQLMTWKENFDKYQKDRVVGKNNKQNKRIGQFTIDGKLVKEHISIRKAARETGLQQSNVSACVNGRALSAGGYLWKEI